MGTCCGANALVDGDDDQNKESETPKEPPKDPKVQQMELQKEMDELRHRQSTGWKTNETPRGFDEDAINTVCAQLVAMGYNDYQCRQAAKYSKNLDILRLIEWMESHPMSDEEIQNSKIETVCTKLKEVNIACHRLQAIHALDQLENETDIIDKAVQYVTDNRNVFLHIDMAQKEDYMLRDQILMASVQSVAHKRQKSLEWDNSKPLLVAELRSMGFLQLQASKAVNDAAVHNKKEAIKWIMTHPLTQEQEINAKVDEIVHFGFTIEEAIAALKKFSNNLDHSIIWLNQGKPYKINHYLYHVKTQKNVVLQNESEFVLAENINFENPYQKWSVWENGLIKNFQCNKLCVIRAIHTKNIRRILPQSSDDKKENVEPVLQATDATNATNATNAGPIATPQETTDINTATNTQTNPAQEADLLSIVEKTDDANAVVKPAEDDNENKNNPFLMEYTAEDNNEDNPFAADNEGDEENKAPDQEDEDNPFDIEPNEAEEEKEATAEEKEKAQEQEKEEVNEPKDIDEMDDLLQFSLSAPSNEVIENDFFGDNATKTEQSEIQNTADDLQNNNAAEKVVEKGADNEAVDSNNDVVENNNAVQDTADDAVAIENDKVVEQVENNVAEKRELNEVVDANADIENNEVAAAEIDDIHDATENKEAEEADDEGAHYENEIEESEDDGKEDEITYELCMISEMEFVSNNNAKIEYLQNWIIDDEERTIKMDISEHNKNKKGNENETKTAQLPLFDNHTNKKDEWYLYLVNRDNRFILDTIFHEYDMQQRWCVLSKIEIQELNPKELAKELDDPDAECIICFDNDPNVVLNPCGHSNFCKQCIDELKPEQCPICRTDVKSILQQ